MTSKQRQQLLTALAMIGIGLLVADRVLLKPLVTGWKQRAHRIADLKKSLLQGESLLDRAGRIQERWDSMKTNTLPAEASEAENQVLNAFDQWSEESRISISGIKPQWRRTEPDYMTLECRAEAFGSIDALTRFLFELEKNPLALKVDSVEITSRDDNGRQLALSLQVSGLLLNPQEP